MPEPKKPQDRKPKAGTIESAGVAIVIPRERLSDWDVIEGIATIQDEQTTQPEKVVATVRVMRLIFGDDYDRVKSELRAANDGHLSMETMGSFLTAAFEQLNPSV